MEHLQWFDEVDLSDSVMVVAFSGWNDAADAATEAARYLARRYDARPIAAIDPEAFYDFASARPSIRLVGEERRELDWPRNQFLLAELENGRPLIILIGIEPRLLWRTFSESVTTAAKRLGVNTVVTLGALLTETHHEQPIDVVGASNNERISAELDLTPSTYEGPTGIIGVLNDACHQEGLDSLSFWAPVPSYLGQSPSPKAALAIVKKVADFLGLSLDATDLQIASASYDRQVTELLESDQELAAYAEQLREELVDDDNFVDEVTELEDNPEALIDELEQFLRQQDD